MTARPVLPPSHFPDEAFEEEKPLKTAVEAIFAPTQTDPLANPKKRARGRPRGSTSPLLAKTTQLQLEDFFFLRSVINGLSATESYARYYGHVESDAQGRLTVPHGNELLARARRLISQIAHQAAQRPSREVERLARELQAPLPEIDPDSPARVSVALDFEAWFESLPVDMYSENELAVRYQEYLQENDAQTAASEQVLGRTFSLQAKLKALNALQTELARRPAPDQDVALWLDVKIAGALQAIQITTLLALVRFISAGGKRWYRELDGIGQGRARRIEQWLDFHAETLPRIDRSMPMWQSQALVPSHSTADLTIDAATGKPITTPAPSSNLLPHFGIVPLERMAVPPELDGSKGAFRSPNANTLGAKTDLDAIKAFLNSFASAGKHKTFGAYRREVERFYLWCLHIARVPLSSIALSHAQAYQIFLRNIPSAWINPNPTERSRSAWRPFRGQLAVKNQNYAIGVLKLLFRHLLDSGYLTSSAFAGVHKSAQLSTGFSIDTQRAFNAREAALIRETLTTLPGHSSPDLLDKAKARRTRLILELLLSTGMRRSELAEASLKNLTTLEIEGIRESAHILKIEGKGKKERSVALSGRLLNEIHLHHAEFRALRAGDATALKHLDDNKPLILSLEVVAGLRNGQKSSQAALSSSGIYRLIKSFYGHASRKARKDKTAAQDRLQRATPHWTRHTFAHAILDSNYQGKGLPIAQKLLGHESLDTTGQYIEQDITDLVLAIQQANLG